ncbi:DUF4236 domain-containing protein [Actinomycetospora endophytica]|uniref:DUF4236 domain-containing protein n=1 Tax=Actinomycetospora endophytica TaxID=2291215 RepID=A0ABS8P5N0_9PSEU|nr:DUF4236 domain-containing protein [Actinomycetospora endophytica]MCD2193551.1 DUF4236 domain-containing protein [Actinomycetospora endophytica]
MGIRYRRRIKLKPLPVWLNISRSERNGWMVSWTVKVAGISWNSRTHKKSVDLPGDWSWHEGSKNHAHADDY